MPLVCTLVNHFRKIFIKKIKKLSNFLTAFSISHKMFLKIDD